MSDDQNDAAVENADENQKESKSSQPNLDEFDAADENAGAAKKQPTAKELDENISAIHDVPVQITAVLGKSTMQVSQLLKLSRGAVVELDRKVGEAIDIYVNNRLVARGEVVMVEDQLGVTMTEIIKSDHAA